MLGQRLVVLRNLVALGQVRIEIILACKNRSLIDAAIQSHRRERGELDRFAVQYRQSSRHAQADGTDIGIWRSAKARGAGAENLRSGQKLDVNFESDDWLVGGEGGDGSVGGGRHIDRL